jgi:hypothetical protein
VHRSADPELEELFDELVPADGEPAELEPKGVEVPGVTFPVGRQDEVIPFPECLVEAFRDGPPFF